MLWGGGGQPGRERGSSMEIFNLFILMVLYNDYTKKLFNFFE